MADKKRTELVEFLDMEERCSSMGCTFPTGFSILPRNFDSAKSKSDFLHEDTTPTVRSLLAEKGIIETKIEQDGDKIPYIQENCFERVGPIIFIGSLVFSENPHLISVALGVVSNFLTDYFKGRMGNKTAKLSLVVPQTPTRSMFLPASWSGRISPCGCRCVGLPV
jgi:hypothetical protein